MSNRLPAYARELAEARKAGMVPASGEVIVALDVWRWGKPQGALARCLVPCDRAVADSDFGFLAGLGVLVAWSSAVTQGERLRALAAAVLAAQPSWLLLLDMAPDVRRRVQWVKSLANGVEVQP